MNLYKQHQHGMEWHIWTGGQELNDTRQMYEKGGAEYTRNIAGDLSKTIGDDFWQEKI